MISIHEVTRNETTSACKTQVKIWVQISKTSRVVTVANFTNHEPHYVFVMINFSCLRNPQSIELLSRRSFHLLWEVVETSSQEDTTKKSNQEGYYSREA